METNLLTDISDAYARLQEYLFANILAPILYQFNLMGWAEDVFDGMDWFLFLTTLFLYLEVMTIGSCSIKS